MTLSHAQERPATPGGWRESDAESPAGRFAVEVARFPSAPLAEGLRTALFNMGWRPVRVESGSGGASVLLGNFRTVADAQAVALDLEAQEVAECSVVSLPPGTETTDHPVEGPLLPPFMPTPGMTERPMQWESVNGRLDGLIRNLPPTKSEELRRYTVKLRDADDLGGVKGAAATSIAQVLARERTDPEVALYLAGRVARGDWLASTEERIASGEIVADLLYGQRRDWRGAWAATQALLEDPERTTDGETRDRLRQAALVVDLAAGAGTPRPSWAEVRAALRHAHDEAAISSQRLLAKIELVYLQTFAWEGDWARVEPLASQLASRPEAAPAEAALAKIFLARSLERREAYTAALQHLSQVMQTDIAPEEQLMMGFKPLDLQGEARKWSEHLTALKTEKGA
ncbi:hypothetical protein HZA57_05635 [Candidatus Poribacteria bacterium]|nr:hypothetical protein [Candidatus Poribacteria bacterium]